MTGTRSESGNGVERTLGKILATQELILKQLEYHNHKLEQHVEEDKEIVRRVTKIENRFNYLYGFTAAVVAVFTLSFDVIATKLGLK